MRKNVSNQQTIRPLSQENGSTENCLHGDDSFKLKGRFRDFHLEAEEQSDRRESQEQVIVKEKHRSLSTVLM